MDKYVATVEHAVAESERKIADGDPGYLHRVNEHLLKVVVSASAVRRARCAA